MDASWILVSHQILTTDWETSNLIDRDVVSDFTENLWIHREKKENRPGCVPARGEDIHLLSLLPEPESSYNWSGLLRLRTPHDGDQLRHAANDPNQSINTFSLHDISFLKPVLRLILLSVVIVTYPTIIKFLRPRDVVRRQT